MLMMKMQQKYPNKQPTKAAVSSAHLVGLFGCLMVSIVWYVLVFEDRPSPGDQQAISSVAHSCKSILANIMAFEWTTSVATVTIITMQLLHVSGCFCC